MVPDGAHRFQSGQLKTILHGRIVFECFDQFEAILADGDRLGFSSLLCTNQSSQCGLILGFNQSGVTRASSFNAARKVSPTSSRRFMVRTEWVTCFGSSILECHALTTIRYAL